MKTETELYDYYQSQINQIDLFETYTQIKISNEKSNTKWLPLNKESAERLVNWLNTNFLNDKL